MLWHIKLITYTQYINSQSLSDWHKKKIFSRDEILQIIGGTTQITFYYFFSEIYKK